LSNSFITESDDSVSELVSDFLSDKLFPKSSQRFLSELDESISSLLGFSCKIDELIKISLLFFKKISFLFLISFKTVSILIFELLSSYSMSFSSKFKFITLLESLSLE